MSYTAFRPHYWSEIWYLACTSQSVTKTVSILTFVLLAIATQAFAQKTAGEASLNLNGTVSLGYGDDTSNVGGSDHSIFGAGNADLSGFYHNPSFLSFDIQPFYNQSRLNSSFQSMTAASGVSASAKIFGGSLFPGSISYATTYNSTGNFGIPGLPNYTTNGDNSVLAVTWGEHLKNLPSLNFNFANTTSTYSVYGATSQGDTHTDTLSATTAYRVAGFSLNGGYQFNASNTTTPEFLSGEAAEQTNSTSNSFFFGVGHNLPMHGSFSASATRLDLHSDYNDSGALDSFNTNINTLTSALSFSPMTNFNVGANAYYTDNLEGTLYNTLLTVGVTSPETQLQEASRDLSLTGTANYDIPARHLDFHGLFVRQQQTFLGVAYTSDAYNGTVSYSNTLLGGSFNGVVGLTETSLSVDQQNMLGLVSSVNYSHPIQRWTVAGGFAYSQDTQTLLASYTSSGYNYYGNVVRRIRRRSFWGAYASGSKSLLTNQPGTANTSQNYSTSFSIPRLSVSGTYSTSSGNALLTTTGLVSTPVPVTALPSSVVVLYNGSSYSAGLGSSPIRGLTVSATYVKALSGTNSNSVVSNNNTENLFCLVMYHFRKLDFQAGYSRLDQGFSVVGTTPTRETSFFVGVSRWFNFF